MLMPRNSLSLNAIVTSTNIYEWKKIASFNIDRKIALQAICL